MRKAAPDSLFKFTRSYRLVGKQDFQSVFAKPNKATRKFLLALYRPNHLTHARLGMMLSKNHVRRAVDRTRLRRVIRESFRQHLDHLKGFDIVILMRAACSTIDKRAWRVEVDHLWQGIGSAK